MENLTWGGGETNTQQQNWYRMKNFLQMVHTMSYKDMATEHGEILNQSEP